MAEYIRTYCCKGTIRAVCEDYRAAAGIALDQDRADDKAGKIKRRCSRSGAPKAPWASCGTCWRPGGPSPPVRSKAVVCRAATSFLRSGLTWSPPSP